MKRILDHVIPPKLGFGLVVKKGQSLRVIDLEGKQVVDMALFNADNTCNAAGMSCLQGFQATDDQMSLCNRVVAQADHARCLNELALA